MVLKVFDLEGKLAVVTGGGRGIGEAIALALAEAGADIVLAARTAGQLEQTAAKVRQLGRKCLAIPTDVTNAEQVQSIVDKTLAEFGKIDILVNNAGSIVIKPIAPLPKFESTMTQLIPDFFSGMTEEEWHRLMDTNLTSVFLCCRAVGPHLIKQGKGRVINVSSIGSLRGSAYRVGYTATKAGVSMFTRSLALEWARYGISVNAIAPGTFKTALTAWFSNDEKGAEQMRRRIPMKRLGKLEEVGSLAVYLASDASDYVTGQTIYIDGGESL
ncbi:SDR family NAD(P)-dependent oxidoreductase [Chloroflexota bacterium]